MLRILSALVMAPVALFCVWLGSPWLAGLLVIIILAAGAEWRTIAAIDGASLRALLIVVPLFVLIASEVGSPAAGVVVLLVGIVLTIGAFSEPLGDRLWTLTAQLHLALPVIAILSLRTQPHTGLDLVAFMFVMVWMSDIGGYITGRLVGGPRMAPRISPNKTWSGAFGAVLFPLAAAVMLAHIFSVEVEPVLAVAAL
ncbi:MAG TPA: hypothetical protein DIT35_09675, partial [Rhodospirillaceae bacterium]|nr:hypothetical protein [Rhodospirillaceae bacterium]